MSKLTFKSNQTHPVTPTSTSKTNGRLLLALTILTTSLLALSCKSGGDADASSREGGYNREGSGPADEHADARPARISGERAAPLSANEREKKHKEAMLKAAIDHQGSDADMEKAFNEALHAWVSDPVLFGERRYASAGQVKDKKVIYHLPKQATRIQMLKEANGHYARYKISEEDFITHMKMIWERYREEYVQQGGKRWIKHSDADAERNLMGRHIGRLEYLAPKQTPQKSTGKNQPKIKQIRVSQAIINAGWKALEDATEYQGPIRTNGGMATYYYDRQAGVAFQNVGYW